MQMPGGHLLAAGLDGGNTLVFSTGENVNRVLLPAPIKKTSPTGLVFFGILEENLPQGAGYFF